MNPIIRVLHQAILYHILSGQSLYSGALALTLAVGLSATFQSHKARIARNLLAGLGGVLILASATPMPMALGLALIGSAMLWVAAEAARLRISGRWVLLARAVLVLAIASALLVEWPYHRRPRVPPFDGPPVLGVIGDSLSAEAPGGDSWPEILADRHGIEVRNQSEAGATVASALRQAEAIGPAVRLVLVEIGGNDLLGDTSPEAFEEGLERLLLTVQQPERIVLMLELPRLPWQVEYGNIQRRLARRHGVLLVPRRVLLGVLLAGGATTDSIHLSPAGHRRMAEALWVVIEPAFQQVPRLSK